MFIVTINKLFLEENNVPRTQGPPQTHKVKQCEIVLTFTVSLFFQHNILHI